MGNVRSSPCLVAFFWCHDQFAGIHNMTVMTPIKSEYAEQEPRGGAWPFGWPNRLIGLASGATILIADCIAFVSAMAVAGIITWQSGVVAMFMGPSSSEASLRSAVL